MLKKLYNLINTINIDPLTLKKAILLCFFVEGIWFALNWFLYRTNMLFDELSQITFLAVVLISVRMMDRDELRRILAWRKIPLPVFGGVLVMFFGFEIIKSELNNILTNLLPIPDGFFNSAFQKSNNVFLIIIFTSLFPGFSEEVFFRGVIARRFFRSYSPVRAILLSAALFGIFHINPWQTVNAFYLGIFLGWIYLHYRSIWLCMFVHAYHNVLAYYMSLPYVAADSYSQTWRHPLWFDALGILLFGFGLFAVIILSRKKETP